MKKDSEKGGEDHVVLGRFGAPYGVKGWVRLMSFTDPRDNILAYRHFKLRDGEELRDVEIDESRPQGKGFVAHVKGCDDRDETRRYTGRELLIEKRALPALESGSFYWHQLEGLTVVTLGGQELGRIDHLMETGANDVVVVKPTPTSIDGEERLIPYVKGQVIREIDLEGGLMRVDWEADL